jgi:hypothetical protein
VCARTGELARVACFGVDAARDLQHLPGQLHVAAVLLLTLPVRRLPCILLVLFLVILCIIALIGTLLLARRCRCQVLRAHRRLALGIHVLLFVLCTPTCSRLKRLADDSHVAGSRAAARPRLCMDSAGAA